MAGNPIDLGDVVAGALAPVDPLEEYAEEIAAAEREALKAKVPHMLKQARQDYKQYMLARGYGMTASVMPFSKFCLRVLNLPEDVVRLIMAEMAEMDRLQALRDMRYRKWMTQALRDMRYRK